MSRLVFGFSVTTRNYLLTFRFKESYMYKPTYNFKIRQRIFLACLCVCLLTGISFLINYKTQAEIKNNSSENYKNNYALKSFSAPQRESAQDVNVGERTSVWLKLQPGKSLDTTFYGTDSAISTLRSDLAEPLSQASTDINADGYADLISGFRNAAGGGLIALHRASRDAFEPQTEETLAGLRRGVFPATFEKDALVLDVPTAPDFILTGKFSQDSAVDLVFASRGGRVIYLMTSDGKGGFNAPQEISVGGGEITALAAEKIDNTQAYAGIVAAVSNGKSSTLLVYSGKAELLKTTPQSIPVESPVDSLILAKKDYSISAIDLFGLADGKLFTVSNIANSRGGINSVNLPYRAVDFAVGEFIRDRRGKAEIAVLSETGDVSYLTNGTLDTRPFTTKEMQDFQRRGLRGFGSILKPETDNLADNWTEAESQNLGVYALGGNHSGILRKAYITGNETEDLMVVNEQAKRVQILFKEPNTDENRTTFTGETEIQNVDFAGTPGSVLPMRLNVMAQQGFVVLNKGSLEPSTVIAAPNVTFNVSKTTDGNDGACNADCSVREAVVAANAAAGTDMVMLLTGTHQLTIDLAGTENVAAEGDLDVTQSLTVVGNGAANSIVQAGTTNANGIDKVFSVNPTFTVPMASSFSSLQMRFGRNPGTFAGDGYGGAVDQELSGTGTMVLSGVTMDSNSTTDGPGGAVAYTQSAAGAGNVSLTNVTITNNVSRRVPVTGSFGGGIFNGVNTPLAITTANVSNNSIPAANPNSNGGGMFINTSTTATFTFSSLTLSGNSLSGQGGGMYTGQGTTINPPTIISNNSATGAGQGGGIYEVLTGETLTISKATMVGNNAAVQGGAIYLQGGTLSMSFSRIVGNISPSFNGLSAVAGTTANVENNWWGCNTGPSAAPCDIAGGGGAVDFNPWLRYTHTASPSSIVVGQSTTLTASFLTNSDNVAVAVGNLDVLIGLPIAFNTPVRGTISGAQPTIQASGTATATFTATSAGAGSANAAVDNGTATANIAIGMAATTTTITSDNPDPSVVGQTITVNYTVAVNAPGMGTPTGNVTVSDGVNSCTGTVAAGTCNVALTTVGARTLTATYAGDANFTGSSDTEPHQVNPANTTTIITAESADPTSQGQVFTVFYAVAVTAPGAGTPTGTVTVTDGVNSCMGTVAAGQCSLFLNTAGMRTLVATYGGNASFNGSVSPGEPHTVLPILAAPANISGRVQTASGRGIANARVTMTDENGQVVTAVSNGFGYFSFSDIQTGETYIFNVRHKEYQFATQVITVQEDITDLTITATN